MNKKIIVITGASRGIGKAIALRFAKEGYSLALCSHSNEQALMQTKKECENLGCQTFAYMVDVAKADEVTHFFEKIHKELGPVYGLINNAAIAQIGLLTDLSVSDWDHIIQTNLSSAFYSCKCAIPDLVHQKDGRIINISSVWGNIGASCEVAYSATKGGINSFTKALAKELAPSNIAVNAVAFGVIDTDMNQCLTKEDKIELIEEIPCNRMGTPEEAANLVYSVFTQSTYLTGQIITMDGGWC